MLARLASALALTAAFGGQALAQNVYGTYQGTCTTYYGNAQPGRCAVTMYVDWNNQITIPGDGACFSPTNFYGNLYGYSAQLRSGGWQAQPQGQYLELNFRPSSWGYFADGSGYGISDRKYQYTCSFQQGWGG